MLGKYPIGTKYMTRGKCPSECTVTDIHVTYNSKDKVVKLRYVAEHQFSGQTVTDYDVPEASIAMGIVTP